MTSNGSRGSGFIGRQQELAVLAAALDDALSGHGQLVMLAGEPGIGKTRLAQELASSAESLGARVLWGRCYEHAGAPPYWPYVQPIRSYIETVDAELLSPQIGPGGSAIAEIVPELRQKLPDLGQPLAAEPEQARFRLFDSVTNFLKNASQSCPLVFVVDDLHWADESSLLMLEFLTREIGASPLLIIGTYRDVEVTGRHPFSKTLGNLVREPHFRRVVLGGLSQQEVGAFVEANAGVSLPTDALVTIHDRTEGNPLFVNAVVELIDPEQINEDRAWADVIPDGVRDAIGSRLSRLSEGCNQVLQTASVIGREFDFSLLRRVDLDISADGVLEALGEALEAKVIEALPGEVERYQFGHALIQQSLYGDLPPIRRVRIHARIGETLELLHQTRLEEHAAELAHYFAECTALLGSEKLARYSSMAGERALAAYAYEDSLAHFQSALNATEEQPMGSAKAAILFGLGRAQSALQQPGALASLSSALDYYVEAGDVDHVVAIAEYPDYGTGTRLTGMGHILAQALELVQPDSHEAGRLLPRYGQYIGLMENDYERARQAFDKALVIAARENDIALEMRILSAAVLVDSNHLRYTECLENSLRAIELAKQVDDPRSELAARYAAVTSLIATGDQQGALRVASAMLEPAERLRDRFWLAGSFWKNEANYRLAGDWTTARDFGERGLAVSSDPSLILEDLIQLEYEVGDFVLGQEHLDRLLEIANSSEPGIPINGTQAYDFGMAAMVLSLTARTANNLDKLALAESTAQTALSAPNLPPSGTGRASIGLAMLAVLRDDPLAAAQHYDEISSRSGTVLFYAISSDRLLGLLSQTMGDLEQAAAHFEDALAFCSNAGCKPELTWSCHDYTNLLLLRNQRGDHEKARPILEEALALATDLGMRPLMERVTALQERAAALPVRAAAYPGGLTAREVEVLRLISGGRTDREIGEDLFISVKTVGNHVSSILNKTNAANRTEAAAYATRQGLA